MNAYTLHPWLGHGGHPECGEKDLFAVGKDHDYRVVPAGAGFIAERRAHGADAWQSIGKGFEIAYEACHACGRAEAGTPTVAPAVVKGPVDYAMPAADTKKLSAVERLALARKG